MTRARSGFLRGAACLAALSVACLLSAGAARAEDPAPHPGDWRLADASVRVATLLERGGLTRRGDRVTVWAARVDTQAGTLIGKPTDVRVGNPVVEWKLTFDCAARTLTYDGPVSAYGEGDVFEGEMLEEPHTRPVGDTPSDMAVFRAACDPAVLARAPAWPDPTAYREATIGKAFANQSPIPRDLPAPGPGPGKWLLTVESPDLGFFIAADPPRRSGPRASGWTAIVDLQAQSSATAPIIMLWQTVDCAAKVYYIGGSRDLDTDGAVVSDGPFSSGSDIATGPLGPPLSEAFCEPDDPRKAQAAQSAIVDDLAAWRRRRLADRSAGVGP